MTTLSVPRTAETPRNPHGRSGRLGAMAKPHLETAVQVLADELKGDDALARTRAAIALISLARGK